MEATFEEECLEGLASPKPDQSQSEVDRRLVSDAQSQPLTNTVKLISKPVTCELLALFNPERGLDPKPASSPSFTDPHLSLKHCPSSQSLSNVESPVEPSHPTSPSLDDGLDPKPVTLPVDVNQTHDAGQTIPTTGNHSRVKHVPLKPKVFYSVTEPDVLPVVPVLEYNLSPDRTPHVSLEVGGLSFVCVRLFDSNTTFIRLPIQLPLSLLHQMPHLSVKPASKGLDCN